MTTKLDAAQNTPASEPETTFIPGPPMPVPELNRPYEPLRKTAAQKLLDSKKRAELEAQEGARPAGSLAREYVPDEKPLGDMTTEEVLQKWPREPPKPLEQYTVHELIGLKTFGPSMIGGILYLKSQAAVIETGSGTLGPAILDKGFTPVPFVSHLNGDQ